MITALIIDDQKSCRDLLKKNIQNYCPDVDVIGEADGVKNGIISIHTLNPNLVFLDVNMNDGTGFDLLEIISSEKGGIENINFKVIFTTAYEQYAVKAFKFSAVDYLLKPVISQELKNAVDKIKVIANHSDSQKKLGVLYDNLKSTSKSKRIVLSTLDSFFVYNIENIVRCESQSNYTKFYFSDGKDLLVSKTMKEFEELLTENDFVRVHNSHIVNLNFIKKVIKTEGGQILMSDGSNVPLSPLKKKSLLEQLEKH